jgi:hypothetical protein
MGLQGLIKEHAKKGMMVKMHLDGILKLNHLLPIIMPVCMPSCMTTDYGHAHHAL